MKSKVFEGEHYSENFIQSCFNALKSTTGIPESLVLGGDGRYLCDIVAHKVIQIAAANGVRRVVVGQHALMSTPAVSAVIRSHASKPGGGFILTASHNSGGPENDFGMKYNASNGGPAPEKLTNLIYEKTTQITEYYTTVQGQPVDIDKLGVYEFTSTCTVEVIDSVAIYSDLMASIFDFAAIKALIQRSDFSLQFDAMHGVAGPYARGILVGILGASPDSVKNADPKPDFAGGHPDPNLTYAKELVKAMGLASDGTPLDPAPASVPSFGAACDGDADRNMILGGRFFVTPSDSVAILAAHANDVIPYVKSAGGLKAVARSMPTSAALDRVAHAKGLPFFEVPTGWKFFGNLMDSHALFNGKDYTPLLCGEESFGTGSSHVREKDGLWAVLAWLSLIAFVNRATPIGQLVTVKQIVEQHWATYGRNYYRRYDYEEVDLAGAKSLMNYMRSLSPAAVPSLPSGATVTTLDDFMYTDPVDASVSKEQGIRVIYSDGSRFVFRLSGTGSVGATVRLYLEQYVPAADVKATLATGAALADTGIVLEPLVAIAVSTAKIEEFTQRKGPTVIT